MVEIGKRLAHRTDSMGRRNGRGRRVRVDGLKMDVCRGSACVYDYLIQSELYVEDLARVAGSPAPRMALRTAPAEGQD